MGRDHYCFEAVPSTRGCARTAFDFVRNTDATASWSRALIIGAIVLMMISSPSFAQDPPDPTLLAADEEQPSPLLEEPQTPDGLLRAADLMVRLARPELASRYLGELLSQDPDDEVLLKLSDQFGPALFLKLANIKALRPSSTDLLERVTRAFRRTGASAERIDGLIDQLSNSPREREVAIRSLRSLGPLAVPRFLARLSDPQFKAEHDRLVDALSRLGQPVVPPLLAALDAPDPKVRADVLQVLGWINATDIVPYLWYPALAPGESPEVQATARQALRRIQERSDTAESAATLLGVTNSLRSTAMEHFRLEHAWPLEEDGTVDFWIWSGDGQNVERVAFSPEQASLHVGLRFSQQALSLSSERDDIQTLYLGLMLADARLQAGWQSPLTGGPGTAHDLALTAGPDLVARTLQVALDNNNSAAATAALQVLAQIGSGQRQLLSGKRSSPVIAALDYPDRRVQFAAAQCLLQLDPAESFAGADRVVSILSRSLNGSTTSAAVVVDPNTRRANQVASLIGELGFLAEVAGTGREGFRVASQRMDIELILLHVNTIRWPLSATVANLRADARTASVPIVVYGPDSLRSRVANLVQRHPPMVYVIEATASQELDAQLRPSLAKWRGQEPTDEQRAQQRAIAAYWLADIAAGGAGVFDLSRAEDALIGSATDGELSDNVLLALSAIPSADTQATLHEITLGRSFEMTTRESAARQLAHHIQQYGLLLSRGQVAEVKAAWQASTDPNLGSALATVLGSLRPNPKQVGVRLREFAQPTPPTQ